MTNNTMLRVMKALVRLDGAHVASWAGGAVCTARAWWNEHTKYAGNIQPMKDYGHGNTDVGFHSSSILDDHYSPSSPTYLFEDRD